MRCISHDICSPSPQVGAPYIHWSNGQKVGMMKHGASLYRRGKCKCEVCRKANAELQAAYRAKYGRKDTDYSLAQRRTRREKKTSE